MKLVEFVPPTPHPLWKLCPQMGITDVIVKVNPDLTGLANPWKYETLSSIVSCLKPAGLPDDDQVLLERNGGRDAHPHDEVLAVGHPPAGKSILRPCPRSRWGYVVPCGDGGFIVSWETLHIVAFDLEYLWAETWLT